MLTSSSRLVNVRQFKEYFNLLLAEDEIGPSPELFLDVDPKIFNTDDLSIVDPDEQIRIAIEREMKRNDHKQQHEAEQQEMDTGSWLSKTFGIQEEDKDDEEVYEEPQKKSTPPPESTPSDMAAALMLTADIPSYSDLVADKPNHLRCLGADQAYEVKSRKRDVNYFTPQMQQVIGDEPVDKNDVILSISFYNMQKTVKMQEYLVLGSQCLTELKDKFYCLSDQVYSECTTKSGYFFIEKVFYNDMRSQNAIDYSTNVIEWVNSNNRFSRPEYGIYSKKNMEATTFNDLSITVGVPYLYCHRGNCEHIMVVNDIRLLHSGDNMNKRAYPVQIFQNKIRRKKCRVCDIHPAKWVTDGDPYSPENPCFYCEQCYNPLHVKSDGTLPFDNIGQVYTYYHE